MSHAVVLVTDDRNRFRAQCQGKTAMTRGRGHPKILRLLKKSGATG